LTRDKLKEFHWETLQHPPYSPHLSPCDYHLFGPLKEALGGHPGLDPSVSVFLRTRYVFHTALQGLVLLCHMLFSVRYELNGMVNRRQQHTVVSDAECCV
jgi:hypothetical protein